MIGGWLRPVAIAGAVVLLLTLGLIVWMQTAGRAGSEMAAAYYSEVTATAAAKDRSTPCVYDRRVKMRLCGRYRYGTPGPNGDGGE